MKYLWTVPVPVPWEAADAAVEDVLVEEEKAAAEAVGGSRRRSMWRRSSARGLPAAAARSRAVAEGSKLNRRGESLVRMQAHMENKKRNVAYTASCRNRFTLYIVISAVGDDEIMMMGNIFSIQEWLCEGVASVALRAKRTGFTSLHERTSRWRGRRCTPRLDVPVLL